MALSAKRPSKLKEELLQDVRSQDDEPKKRLNLDVEASLHRRMKAQAVNEGRSVADITRALWAEYLSKHSNE
ncbi:MAG: plasmid partition protein ParG [Pseudomonadota bacterium]|nr:plasmid partition protein ParG [Pseudomonadota bacterium]